MSKYLKTAQESEINKILHWHILGITVVNSIKIIDSFLRDVYLLTL